jgi:hypothetical protein
MIAIKDVAKKMNLDEFNRRFEEETQGVRDRATGKIYFCPNDLGFKLNRSNCIHGLVCKECWIYAKEHLRANKKCI